MFYVLALPIPTCIWNTSTYQKCLTTTIIKSLIGNQFKGFFMSAAPLIISNTVIADLAALKTHAENNSININEATRAFQTEDGRKKHLDQMNSQTMLIRGPWNFFVTYSVETGHPGGTYRHMSMSIKRGGRVPHPIAVSMIAQYLGFVGDIESYDHVYVEDLSDGGRAINVLQEMK